MSGANMPARTVVTGAFGYSGKYIAQRLLAMGEEVVTLTNHPKGDPFAGRVRVAPLDFGDAEGLRRALEGASALINTYWVRFPHGKVTHQAAVENTRALIAAAREAGVRRMVHVSITHPSLDSRLSYFRGKAELEEAVRDSGMSYAILRPTVLFGKEDILVNNIAWLLRHWPVFAIPGDGKYQLQPIYVDDLAQLAVEAAHRGDSYTQDAVGPEILTYDELVKLVRNAVGSRASLWHLPPRLVFLAAKTLGWTVGDVLLTWEEVVGLMENLLVSEQAPPGTTRLSDWVREHAATLGREYHSEIQRHFR